EYDEASERLSPHHRMHGVAMAIELHEITGDWEAIRALVPRTRALVADNLATPCVRNSRSLLACAAACAALGDDAGSRALETAAHPSERRSFTVARPSLQEDGRAEAEEPVEPPERSIRHQEVHPRIQAEAAIEEVTGGHLIGRRNLEIDPLEAHGECPALDVQQDVRQVRGIEGRDRAAAAPPDESEADHRSGARIEVALAVDQQPSDLVLVAG